jgi:hypothetical protein
MYHTFSSDWLIMLVVVIGLLIDSGVAMAPEERGRQKARRRREESESKDRGQHTE